MKHMQKLISMIILVLAMTVMLFGCAQTEPKGQPEEPTSKQSEKQATETPTANNSSNLTGKVVAATIVDYEMPWFNIMMKGMQKAADEEGIELLLVNGENDPAKQLDQVNEFVSKNVDLIILNPSESKALVSAVETVNKSGIPLVTVDRGVDVPEDQYVSYVGHDWLMSGLMNALQIVDQMGGEGNLAIIEGAPGSESNISRMEGWNTIHKLYPKINIIFDQTANWLRTEGMKVTEDLLQSHDDIDCIWYVAEEMYYGGIQAIQASGRRDEFKIVTQDGSALDMIEKGLLDAELVAQPEYQGYVVVKTACKILKGEEVPKWVKIPLVSVDSTNVTALKDRGWSYDDLNK